MSEAEAPKKRRAHRKKPATVEAPETPPLLDITVSEPGCCLHKNVKPVLPREADGTLFGRCDDCGDDTFVLEGADPHGGETFPEYQARTSPYDRIKQLRTRGPIKVLALVSDHFVVGPGVQLTWTDRLGGGFVLEKDGRTVFVPNHRVDSLEFNTDEPAEEAEQ